MSDVFLGEPPQDIKEWMIDHRPIWTQFGKQLKSFNIAKLPQVGSYVTVPYKVDPEGEAVDTEWQILGYNKSIPSRIRYINEKDEIFVPTMIGNELSAIGVGTPVYSGKETVETIGTLDSVSEEIKVNPGNEINGEGHTYGNNNPYDAPESVNFDGKDWNFAGYNATIMSKCGLVAKYDEKLFLWTQFDSENHNDWKNSEIREWLNGTEEVSTQRWYYGHGTYMTGIIKGLLGRLPDQDFMDSIIPTVNRTWVHSDWRVDQSVEYETYVDRFWILGAGNVNNNSQVMKDYIGDTSKFDEVFTASIEMEANTTLQRKSMNEDGTEGNLDDWWLRSAYNYTLISSYGKAYCGFVGSNGAIAGAGAKSATSVLPVCLIG